MYHQDAFDKDKGQKSAILSRKKKALKGGVRRLRQEIWQRDVLNFSSIRRGQSTVGGPKWTKIDPLRPKWTKMDHFGSFWYCEYQNPVRNKVILTTIVALTILGHFGQYTF